MAEHHADLASVGVTVSVLMATNEEGDSPLKKAGYPCLALIKVNGLSDRSEGKADATLKIDAGRWDNLDEAEQRALLDHECVPSRSRPRQAEASETGCLRAAQTQDPRP
jgi:hypothetical protein